MGANHTGIPGGPFPLSWNKICWDFVSNQFLSNSCWISIVKPTVIGEQLKIKRLVGPTIPWTNPQESSDAAPVTDPDPFKRRRRCQIELVSDPWGTRANYITGRCQIDQRRWQNVSDQNGPAVDVEFHGLDPHWIRAVTSYSWTDLSWSIPGIVSERKISWFQGVLCLIIDPFLDMLASPQLNREPICSIWTV